MIYNKPDFSTGVWADEGNIAYPTSEKIEQGHIVEKPFYEVMNFLQNRNDTANAYLLQNGLPEWDRLTTYPINAYIKHNGIVYRSLSQNEDSEPSQTSQIWKQAFADYETFLAVVEDVRRIKSEEGYLNLYVSKQNPVLNGKAKGVGYTANSGLISTGNESVGYGFNNHTRDGIYHDGVNPVAMNDGVITGKFTNATDNMQYLTRSQVNALIEQVVASAIRYKIGDLYFTMNQQNPAVTLGYGTWSRFASGRAIVGASTVESPNPEWTKVTGLTYGSYTHTLTLEEMPKHNHGVSVSAARDNYSGSSGNRFVEGGFTEYAGGSQPHNNVQPSIVVNIWQRVS